MENLELAFKVITPMFLHGMSKKPELRVPSIRGILRFWWRATQVREDMTHAELRKIESDIFGGIGDGAEDGKKSALLLRIEPWIIDNRACVSEKMLPHKKQGDANAIKTETIFTIKAKFDEKKISAEELKALFFVVSTLGGLGKRSRRGFGSFESVSSEEETDITGKLIADLKCLNDGIFGRVKIKDQLMDKIKLINLAGKAPKLFSVGIAYPYIKEIEIGKSKDTYDELLKHIGNVSHTCNSKATGNAIGKRQASPIYVSIIKALEKSEEGTNVVFKPVVTTLHNTEQVSIKDKEEAEKFVKAVLGKI